MPGAGCPGQAEAGLQTDRYLQIQALPKQPKVRTRHWQHTAQLAGGCIETGEASRRERGVYFARCHRTTNEMAASYGNDLHRAVKVRGNRVVCGCCK